MSKKRALAPGPQTAPTVAALAAGLLASLAAAGCSSSASETDADGAGASNRNSSTAPTALVFEQPLLTLRPAEWRELAAHAIPEGAYALRFALLGDARDASLDRMEAVTDDSGRALVGLTAPTGAVTTFTVRASAGTAASAEAVVSVSGDGFGTLEVRASYSGTRTVSSWVASVHPGTECGDLEPIPAPDGDLRAETENAAAAAVIEGVPVASLLAVTLRAEQFAGGCAEVSGLAAGERTEVVVPVADVPLRLDQTDLDVVLEVQDVMPSWPEVLEPLAAQAAAALVGTSDDDVAALLDAMQESAPEEKASAIADARVDADWDNVVADTWGAEAATAIQQVVADWLQRGAAEPGVDTIQGRLTATQIQGQARLRLETFAGVAAGAAGFTTRNDVSWTADPDDTVLLGANLPWLASEWLATRAQAAATAEFSEAADVPGALALQFDCSGLSAALLEAADAAGSELRDTCGPLCLSNSCASAFETLFARVRAASSAEPPTLRVSAVAKATVDEVARPEGFEGSWLGTLETELGGSFAGPASGSTPPPPE